MSQELASILQAEYRKEPWMNPSRAAVRDYRGSMSLVFDPNFRNQASEDTTKPSSNQLHRWTTRRLRSSSSDGEVSDAKPKHCTLQLTCRREQMNPGSARSSVWSCRSPPGTSFLWVQKWWLWYDHDVNRNKMYALGFFTLFFLTFLTCFLKTSNYYIIYFSGLYYIIDFRFW